MAISLSIDRAKSVNETDSFNRSLSISETQDISRAQSLLSSDSINRAKSINESDDVNRSESLLSTDVWNICKRGVQSTNTETYLRLTNGANTQLEWSVKNDVKKTETVQLLHSSDNITYNSLSLCLNDNDAYTDTNNSTHSFYKLLITYQDQTTDERILVSDFSALNIESHVGGSGDYLSFDTTNRDLIITGVYNNSLGNPRYVALTDFQFVDISEARFSVKSDDTTSVRFGTVNENGGNYNTGSNNATSITPTTLFTNETINNALVNNAANNPSLTSAFQSDGDSLTIGYLDITGWS